MNALMDKQSQNISQKAQGSNQRTCSEILANMPNVIPNNDQQYYSYGCGQVSRNVGRLAELHIRMDQFRAQC